MGRKKKQPTEQKQKQKQKQKQSVTVNIYDKKPKRVKKKKKSSSQPSIIQPIYQTVVPLIPQFNHVQHTNSQAQRQNFQNEINQEQHVMSMTHPHLQDQITQLANTLSTSFGEFNNPAEIRGRMPIEVPRMYNNEAYNADTPPATPSISSATAQPATPVIQPVSQDTPVRTIVHRKPRDEAADYMEELKDMKRHSEYVGRLRGPASKNVKNEDKAKVVNFAKEIADQFNNRDLKDYASQPNQNITKSQLFSKIRAILRSA